MFKVKNLLIKVAPENAGVEPCPTPTCGTCTCTDKISFCDFPTNCGGATGCRGCTDTPTECTLCTAGCTICTDGCTQPTIRTQGAAGCTLCTAGCTCTVCTDGCTICTDGCTQPSAGVTGRGDTSASRLSRLTALKQQLRERLAAVESETRILERGLAPQTVEEIEALEAQLDDAKAELAERKAALEGDK